MGESEGITSASEITPEHIDNFKWILFTAIHEVNCHITHDLGNGSDNAQEEHEACGNFNGSDPSTYPRFEEKTGLWGLGIGNVDLADGSDMKRAFYEIQGIEASKIQGKLFNLLSKFRDIQNSRQQNSTGPKRIWRKSSPLESGGWEYE